MRSTLETNLPLLCVGFEEDVLERRVRVLQMPNGEILDALYEDGRWAVRLPVHSVADVQKFGARAAPVKLIAVELYVGELVIEDAIDVRDEA